LVSRSVRTPGPPPVYCRESERAQAIKTDPPPKDTPGKLGTFPGVFTPSILTILGIILFLRLGYVVGQAGLGRSLVIIGLANAISVLTSFSLSAIATNLKVKGGGDYYLISRTLGVEYGGAIGLVLFLAQSVSVAFYSIGFGEVLVDMIPGASPAYVRLAAAAALCALFVLAWLGADWATRFQYLVMAALAAALISFFIGGLPGWELTSVLDNWTSPQGGSGFWLIFAIFFPAVTGFTQGVSMSGDLKDPGRSLPLGTFLAVGISILVYFAVALVLAGNLPLETLARDYRSMKRIAGLPYLIDAGVVAATLSSAMASFLGAPRILQALAKDRIIPFLNPLAKGSGPLDNPRRGVLVSLAIALPTVGLGKLNLIAPVVSMFFLISYGLLNYATFFEARSASPSFRPRFRYYDQRLSLLGFLACLGAMLAINLAAGLAAVAVLMAVYQYLQRTSGPARWADSRRSYHLQRIREHLLAAAGETEHPRDWRPEIAALTHDPERLSPLLRLAGWLEGGTGLTVAVRLLEGKGARIIRRHREAEEDLSRALAEKGLKAFPLVVDAPDLRLGLHVLLQAIGLGPLKVNTILVDWPRRESGQGVGALNQLGYGRGLRIAFRLGFNLVILRREAGDWAGLEAEPRIDVWWRGDATSRLMLLLAYLMTRNEAWSKASIRLLASPRTEEKEAALEGLEAVLQEARIEARPEVVEDLSPETITRVSAASDLVFLPFRLKGDSLLGPGGLPLEELARSLPSLVMVMAAGEVDLDAEPEEGQAGELAAAMDALAEARARLQEAEREAASATQEVEERLSLIEGSTEPPSGQELTALVKAVLKAKDEAQQASRQAARAKAKAELAAREVEALGGSPLPLEEPEKTRED